MGKSLLSWVAVLEGYATSKQQPRIACDFEFNVFRKSDLTYQLDNTKAKDSE